MREDAFWSLANEVLRERVRQHNKWGFQNWPVTCDTPGDSSAIAMRTLMEQAAKGDCDNAARRGTCTWDLILAEEIAEVRTAWATGDTEELRKELVQCAAVLFAIIDCLDRGGR